MNKNKNKISNGVKQPNFAEEKKLWKRGLECVVGLDEVGRGPLAGPVVAAAFCLKPNSKFLLKGINDSKKLSQIQRENFYKILTSHSDVQWGIGIVYEKIIDKINILEATKLAMSKALKNLKSDFLLIDGTVKLNCATEQKQIIKGDQKVFSIAASSIIAKVTRDRLMQKMHAKYPEYGFDQHKGYGTRAHFANLEKFGPCEIHRKSFYPVRSLSMQRKES